MTLGHPDGRPLPLAGIRIADFSQVIAGPYGMQLLAYAGAEVIKIESEARPDSFRMPGYGVYGQGINAARPFAEFNRNKRSVSLDMRRAEARDLARRIVAVSDVMVENFSYGVVQRWGLGYDDVRGINPGLVMLSAQGMGAVGPRRDWVSYGPSLLAYAGFTWMWNHPGRLQPVGSQVALPDYVVSIQGALAIVAALDHRRRTGEGQYLQLAQVAGAAALLPTALLEWSVNHQVTPPRGNTDPQHAPYGVYPCRGDDRWCAITVTNEEQWAGLLRAMGKPAWGERPEFATPLTRARHTGELDALVASWTRTRDPHEAMGLLQAEGVPVGAVQNGRDLFYDPHLRERGMLAEVEHPAMPTLTFPGIPYRLSETPPRLLRHAPLLGQDNTYVLGDLLGLSPGEVAALAEAGVVR